MLKKKHKQRELTYYNNITCKETMKINKIILAEILSIERFRV